MDVFQRSLKLHENLKGKISTELKAPLQDALDLSLVYSPGVAAPCRAIAAHPETMVDLTWTANTIAVVSNGTAVLGLGNIGARAALPVMEGKCALFKRFGGVNAVPLVIEEEDPKALIDIVKKLSVGFGGINLEDIKAPECIEIETTLKKECDIPIFHDDQHGTAIVVTAGLINALKIVNKKPEEMNLVISGTGAAGSSIIRMLLAFGIGNIYAFNSKGLLNRAKKATYTRPLDIELAAITNKDAEDLSLAEAMAKADLFVGVSVPNKITKEMVRSMRRDPIVFALANPDPEIGYEEAIAAGARIAGTGRSDFPNQVNNVLAFPGVFKGALLVQASEINDAMKMAAARGLAELISDEDLKNNIVIPSPFDPRVADAVAQAIAEEAVRSGVAGRPSALKTGAGDQGSLKI